MTLSPAGLATLLAALAAIGPFSIDTYLPAFPAMGAELGATQIEVQQTLTAYMLTFALMALWHGALSDAFGRRRVIIVATSLFGAASLLCAFATSIEGLWVGRALQGMSAGAGMVVGRAVIRDLFDGARAQRLMSRVMMIFGIAPAVAPMVGGVLLLLAGWRSIFLFLAAFAGLLTWLSWRYLPETLSPESRQSMHPGRLARAYGTVLGSGAFLLLAFTLAFNFNGFFVFVLSAPVFVMEHLGLGPGSFGWLFVPAVAGMIGGAWLSGRVAGKWNWQRTIGTGFVVMIAAVSLNVAHAAMFAPSLPWSVLPVGIYSFGMALAMPSLTLLVLDMFPTRRGLASSCQSFVQVGLNAVTAGVSAPLLWASPLSLGAGASVFVALGLLCFVVWAGRKTQ